MMDFSVIIPTRDRPQYLHEAVSSVFQQSIQNLQVIVVDDGAEQPLLKPDPRLSVVSNDMKGAVAARNLGVAEAHGKYIAFLDDDDIWTDDSHLAKALEALSNKVDFYFADGMMRYPSGERKLFARDASATTLAHDNTILISTVSYSKSLHSALGEFDELLPYYWDWDWYLRVARGNFAMERNATPVVDIRVHAQNMSGDSNVLARQSNLDLLCAKHRLSGIALKNHTDFV